MTESEKKLAYEQGRLLYKSRFAKEETKFDVYVGEFNAMNDEKYIYKIAEYAEQNKIKIAFNPSNYLAEKGTLFLRNILARTEFLILNKQEAEILVGKGDFLDLINKLMSFGSKLVVITDGKHGSHTYSNGYYYHIITMPVKVVETTGAGDSFAASFLSGMIKNLYDE